MMCVSRVMSIPACKGLCFEDRARLERLVADGEPVAHREPVTEGGPALADRASVGAGPRHDGDRATPGHCAIAAWRRA